jgi:hypothetical protein
MENRITDRIVKKKAEIADRIANGVTTQEKVDQTNKKLNMSVSEHAKFQELKSLAFAHKLLTQDEAQAVYVLLARRFARSISNPWRRRPC